MTYFSHLKISFLFIICSGNEKFKGDNMNIGYCEDEIVQAELIKKNILEWTKKKSVDCRVDLYQSAEEFLFKAERFSYDLLFLDISMKEMSGMDLAREIRKKDPDVKIVFLTSDQSYVFEGYEVDAFRYLVKPVDLQKLYEILALVERAGNTQKENHIILKVENENVRVPIEDIVYLEAQGHYVHIHRRTEREIVVKDSFANLVERVNKNGEYFVLAHRSYAVNLRMVNKIGKTECELAGGERIPVSRNAYRTLNDAFIQYNMEQNG